MFKKISPLIVSLVLFALMPMQVFAQAVDPTTEISGIVDRIITIATQVGSGILILFIVKDAFDLMARKDDPTVRNAIARDVFLLIIAVLFLFRPDFILDAIRFVAGA